MALPGQNELTLSTKRNQHRRRLGHSSRFIVTVVVKIMIELPTATAKDFL